jgi:DNA uptake protein ComE-like DNA-binding protein
MKTLQLFLIVGTVLVVVQPIEAQVGKNQGVVNPNLATKEDLVKLPGIDAAIADSIIEKRPFSDMVQLDKLLGPSLNEEKRKALYEKMFVPINLNKASKEEVLLVPGVGKKMAHEFEEYRPYEKMARFRKEIGKYVDKDEVARLEQYVFVPIDLNTASEADILTIPGLGKRMLHEFLEYRPYQNMEQFRREIGKYVSKKEVARFERYVTIAGVKEKAP